MKRFILLTFGFLGLAFYELSGGADFEPPRPPVSEVSPIKEKVATAKPHIKPQSVEPQIAPQAEQMRAKIKPVDTTPPGFDDTSGEETAQDIDLLLSAVNEAVKAAEAPLVNQVTLVPQNIGSTTSSQDTPAIIPSLITPGDTGAVALDTGRFSDLRSVSGNSVNVRGGPGTQYEVVTQLSRGDSVEILGDSGTGWVQIRPINGGPEGWMADYLLSDS
ncbi:SH3 domain-containing protein [Sulfitobacter sp.]|jgi:hypothetical protein|uniref:SH3 domain-containing protein n=1 Tax=Sulfitobacter sp. TaxID=1903071 RepID=UPI0039E5B9C4